MVAQNKIAVVGGTLSTDKELNGNSHRPDHGLGLLLTLSILPETLMDPYLMYIKPSFGWEVTSRLWNCPITAP